MPTNDPFIGREILGGQFKILQKIGTGGMGSVYKAAQPAMNRMVAIKILHPKLTARSDLVARFRREARAMSQLNHPNTVKVFMYGELEDDGSLYIVMEHLEGRNLNRKVKREGPLGVEQGVTILVQVAGALQEAHNMGIVHRDLKPENIFLCKQVGIDEFPKVLDFGLAKVTEQQMQPGSVNLTQEGMVFGTPEFMSPEQAQGKQLDPRSDIYSLAIILYEALTGKLPFDARTPMEYIQKHVVEPPIPMSQRVEGLTFPPGLDDVVAKGMAKRRGDRYQSAIQFAAALRPFAGASGTALDNIFQMTPEPPAAAGVAPAPAPAPAAPPAAAAPAAAAPAASGTGTGTLVAVAAICLIVGAALTIAILKFVGQ